MEEWADEAAPAPFSIPAPSDRPGPDAKDRLTQVAAMAKAKELLGTRRRRNAMFGNDQFGEPAWDIMLELFVAWVERRRVPVKSVCIGSGAPMSTALRRINQLIADGAIVRRKRDGGERYLLELDETVAMAMVEVLIGRAPRES